MTDRPILFNGEMVRAILAGRKTQTRRLVTPATSTFDGSSRWPEIKVIGTRPDADMDSTQRLNVPIDDDGSVCYVRPRVETGDLLWVRETFYCDHCDYPDAPIAEMKAGGMLDYRADHDCNAWEAGCPCHGDDGRGGSAWRPSVHMPRWASRITLAVTSVRVERLQDMGDRDAESEGAIEENGGFAGAWDRAYGNVAPWSSDPWVWVVHFVFNP